MHSRRTNLAVDLSNTVVVVIGAGQGIGQALAVAFAESGAHVVAASRTREALEQTRELGSSSEGEISVEIADVTRPETLVALADRVASAYGPATVLINSAGAHSSAMAFDVTVDEWDRVHDTQLRGTFFSCQAFGRQMADQGYGKIINLSSTWAATVADGRSVYSAAKAGVSHLTVALACEWARFGIRVNAVAPTATKTPATEARLALDPSREQKIASQIPLGRWATPDDIVGAALFLASNASDFVTGQVLFVDGGWVASK